MALGDISSKCQFCKDGVRSDGLGSHECSQCSGTGRFLTGYIDLSDPPNVVEGYKVVEAIVMAEYNELSGDQQEAVRNVLCAGKVDLNEGRKGRAVFQSYFGADSATWANVQELLV